VAGTAAERCFQQCGYAVLCCAVLCCAVLCCALLLLLLLPCMLLLHRKQLVDAARSPSLASLQPACSTIAAFLSHQTLLLL
jgi:hypothetical protein